MKEAVTRDSPYTTESQNRIAGLRRLHQVLVPMDLVEKAQQANEGQAGDLEVGWYPCAGVGLCDEKGSACKLSPCAG